MMRRTWMFLTLCLGVLLVGTSLVAQTTTASISGTLTDETGARLPGVQVTVTNTATGIRRSVTSDGSGHFVAPQLNPGPYELSATMQGFETLVRSGITLTIGQAAELTLAMKVGQVNEQVTVTEDAPLVNTSSSAVSGLVEEKRISELPLNGRDFSQLPLVQSGVAAVRNGDVTVSKGYGARISMGGSRPDQTAWLLDGTNIHSLSNFGTPGSAAGVMLGVDAVREFQVLTSNYSAEFGGTSGGVVNMVSKSGTNQFHGTLYEFLRNSKLDARNFFDAQKPPFKRNQYGASIGGPVLKDRLFFFGNYEGLKQRLQVTNPIFVPDINTHRSPLVAASIRPYLDLWPLPTSPVTNSSGTGSYLGSGLSPVDENFFVTRIDSHLNDKQTLFGRFSFDQGSLQTPDAVPITETSVGVHSRYLTIQHDYIASAKFLMTSRVAFNRTLLKSTEAALISYPDNLNIFMPGQLPTLSFPGVAAFGPSTSNMGGRVQNLYDFQESMQYIGGRHSMRFGVDFTHIGTNINGQASGVNGTFTYRSLNEFLTDQPASATTTSPLTAFNAAAYGGSTFRSYVQYVYGFYFQDDWKMRPNFTWNIGLRYEPYTAPTEKWNRLSTLKDWLHDTEFNTKISLFKSPGKKDLSPRLGFAWDPKGNGKTAIRAGVGLFFVDLLGPYYITPGMKNAPFFGSTAVIPSGLNLATAVAYITRITPDLLNPKLTPNVLPEIIQWDLQPSYELKFNFGIEQQLPGNTSLSVGYLGNRGTHLWRVGDINDIMPITLNGRSFIPSTSTVRPNPNSGVGTTRYSDAKALYNALQVEVKKRMSHGLQVQTSYTWSKNIDDSTTGVAQTDFTPGGNGSFTQPYSPKADRGLSSLNVGQTFVVNGIYEIPALVQSGVGSVLTKGWQIASIFTASSGAPFSALVSGRSANDGSRASGIQRPDLVAGRSFNSIVSGTTAGCGTVQSNGQLTIPAGKIGTPNRYFDPCAFITPPTGFYGNAGRNILIGPGLVNLDFSLHKSTPLGFKEGARLDFSADFFNILNRANFALPRAPQAQVVNPANGSYLSTAGVITNTVTASRQMQFGLKIVF